MDDIGAIALVSLTYLRAPLSSLFSPKKIKQMGVDYATFRDLLKAGEWEKADDEHRRLMCVLAGVESGRSRLGVFHRG